MVAWGLSGRGQEGETLRGREKTLEGDGYIHYLDCGDGITHVSVYTYVKSYQIVYSKLCVIYCITIITTIKVGEKKPERFLISCHLIHLRKQVCF